MESELFQGGVLMHSYLRAVGFSKITKRSSIRQIITDVVETYDDKIVIEDHPDGVFAEFSFTQLLGDTKQKIYEIRYGKDGLPEGNLYEASSFGSS